MGRRRGEQEHAFDAVRASLREPVVDESSAEPSAASEVCHHERAEQRGLAIDLESRGTNQVGAHACDNIGTRELIDEPLDRQ
jgi:hypothetical protein